MRPDLPGRNGKAQHKVVTRNGSIMSVEPPHDKTNKMACAPSEDSDQPGHLPSLIRVFAVRMKKAWVLSYPLSVQRRLWSDWADAQVDLRSRRWAHTQFVGFVRRRLSCLRPGILLSPVVHWGWSQSDKNAHTYFANHHVAYETELSGTPTAVFTEIQLIGQFPVLGIIILI